MLTKKKKWLSLERIGSVCGARTCCTSVLSGMAQLLWLSKTILLRKHEPAPKIASLSYNPKSLAIRTIHRCVIAHTQTQATPPKKTPCEWAPQHKASLLLSKCATARDRRERETEEREREREREQDQLQGEKEDA